MFEQERELSRKSWGRHTHQIWGIELESKTYVFKGSCWCGKNADFVEWYRFPPKGWSRRQWKRARLSIFEMILLLRNIKG